MNWMSLKRRVLIAGGLAMLAGGAIAQDAWPGKPVRLVVPFASGGSTDVIARMLGQKLSVMWGQPVIVDNRAGAGGNVGADVVAKSPGDGYTLLMASGSITINPALYKKMPFDTKKDLLPIVNVAQGPMLVVVQDGAPYKTLRDLIAAAKAKPGTINFASAGIGSQVHLAGENFADAAGMEIQHVPYKGDAQSVPDVVAGNVPVIFCSVQAGMKWVESGRLRALGVTSAARVPVVRDIPPIAEAGLPGYDLTSWYAVVVPAGTPKDIIATLNSALLRAMADVELKSKIEAMGGILAPGTPEQLRQHLQQETVRWSRLVQQANVKL